MSKKSEKYDSDIIIYSVVGGAIICYFVPVFIPYVVAWGGLLGSIYGIADIISKSDYVNNNYIEKENIEYFKKESGK